MSESKRVKHISISQKQAIIKFLEKPDKDLFVTGDQFFIKFSSKNNIESFSCKAQKVPSSFIDPCQTAYVNGRYINVSRRLISDIKETCNIENLSGYLITLDFQKAFDSLHHCFLLAVLCKHGFGETLLIG